MLVETCVNQSSIGINPHQILIYYFDRIEWLSIACVYFTVSRIGSKQLTQQGLERSLRQCLNTLGEERKYANFRFRVWVIVCSYIL